VGRHQRLELADDRGVVAQGELGLDPQLLSVQSELIMARYVGVR